MPSRWMLTVSLHNLTLDEYIQEQEALNVHIHELYRLYDVIYLVDLDKSAGIPLFSSHAVAGELMEKCLFMRQFLQHYARSYIHPDDCQRFLDFTDYTALKRKLSEGAAGIASASDRKERRQAIHGKKSRTSPFPERSEIDPGLCAAGALLPGLSAA